MEVRYDEVQRWGGRHIDQADRMGVLKKAKRLEEEGFGQTKGERGWVTKKRRRLRKQGGIKKDKH